MTTVLKFISGVLLAIAILFIAGAGATRYLIGRLSVPPEKPVFENESPATPTPAATPVATAATPPAAEPPAEEPESPSPTPSAENPETYAARVVQPIGLILREEPTSDSRQIAGLEYNTEIQVIEENEDGSWLRVQLPSSGVEGWIKSGNTEEIQ